MRTETRFRRHCAVMPSRTTTPPPALKIRQVRRPPRLLRIAIPTALANLAEYAVPVALRLIGRRGSADDRDAVGLGRSYFNISCFSTSYGLTY